MSLGRNPIVIHYVFDMGRATRFYRSVFDVDPSFESSGWTTLGFQNFELALHILTPNHDTEDPLPHAGLNLEVDDIESMQIRIEEHGGELRWLREPETNVPVRVASFVDCEGNGFELRQAPA